MSGGSIGGDDVDHQDVGPPELPAINQELIPVLVRVRRHHDHCLRRKRKNHKIKCPGPHKRPRRPKPPPRATGSVTNMNQNTHITIGRRAIDDSPPNITTQVIGLVCFHHRKCTHPYQ